MAARGEPARQPTAGGAHIFNALRVADPPGYGTSVLGHPLLIVRLRSRPFKGVCDRQSRWLNAQGSWERLRPADVGPIVDM